MKRAAILNLRLSLLLGIPILAVLLALWLVQQHNVNSLDQQLDALQQQIDTLPATVAPTDKLALQKDRLILEKDRVNTQNAIYGTLVQALGGVFFFVTAWLTWRNLRVAEEKQVTERFTKAVELLGNDKLEVRLGAIYALERIAKDSEKDYWIVMEILTGFLRERTKLRSGNDSRVNTTDIFAIMTILNRRSLSYKRGEEYPLDLIGSDFSWIYLFSPISFKEMNLWGADFQQSMLTGCEFTGAILREAKFNGTMLTEADLSNASCERANFCRANLCGANLSNTKLRGANLSESDLREATGLTQAQISEAITDARTELPDYLQALKSSQPEPLNPEQP